MFVKQYSPEATKSEKYILSALVTFQAKIPLALLVVLRIYVASAVFQPYRDFEAGNNQSLKIQVTRPV